MDEQHLVDPLEVGRRAGVDGEARLVGQPGDGGIRGERDPVRKHLAARRVDHVEHALLVAVEREPVGDARAQGRREEPVERGIAGIDEHSARRCRCVSDDEGAGIDPEPVIATAHGRSNRDASKMGRDGSAELVEAGPVAKHGVGQLVLVRLPGEGLVGAELERTERIIAAARQRSSLFASWSNHIPNSVNWVPEIRSSATSTTVAVVISLSKKMREHATTSPSSRPSTVISVPRT